MRKKLEKLIEGLPEIKISEPMYGARITTDHRNVYWVYGRVQVESDWYLLVKENPRADLACIPFTHIQKLELMRI